MDSILAMLTFQPFPCYNAWNSENCTKIVVKWYSSSPSTPGSGNNSPIGWSCSDDNKQPLMLRGNLFKPLSSSVKIGILQTRLAQIYPKLMESVRLWSHSWKWEELCEKKRYLNLLLAQKETIEEPLTVIFLGTWEKNFLHLKFKVFWGDFSWWIISSLCETPSPLKVGISLEVSWVII